MYQLVTWECGEPFEWLPFASYSDAAEFAQRRMAGGCVAYRIRPV